MELTALQDYLRAHASTLQFLHLINMQCSANEGPEEKKGLVTFSSFVARELQLTGIEMIEVDLYGHVEIPSNSSSKEAWLVPDQSPICERRRSGLVECVPCYTLENACLGGRANVIHRRRLPTREDETWVRFGNLPAHM